MRRFFATLDAALCAAGRWLVQPLGERIVLVTLLSIHGGLLAYSATRHSPTHLEPAFLASGISHWQLGRFDLYRVNPPLPRMIAAVPVLIAGCKTDWTRYNASPDARAEYAVGEDFIRANGRRSVILIMYARWACIPFSVLGGAIAFRWASHRYGGAAGLLTLFLWTFEPNLLAHAELVTPDCACWSSGVIAAYAFWRWLSFPTWYSTVVAGFTMGIAVSTKLTWTILFAVWPTLWVMQLLATQSALIRPRATISQLATLLTLALTTLNATYCFADSFAPLHSFTFSSNTFSRAVSLLKTSTFLGGDYLINSRVPVPKQYLLGVDVQLRDLEHYGQPSYLRGEWRSKGWRHYYLYGLLVKLPVSLLLLALIYLGCLARHLRLMTDDLPHFVPAMTILIVASLQTSYNMHLRYVLPSVAFSLVPIGSVATYMKSAAMRYLVITASLHYSAGTLLSVPHQLSYFNEFVGGSSNGSKHLLGSSYDWGQSWLDAIDVVEKLRGTVVGRYAFCTYDPAWIGLQVAPRPLTPGAESIQVEIYAPPFDVRIPNADMPAAIRCGNTLILVPATPAGTLVDE